MCVAVIVAAPRPHIPRSILLLPSVRSAHYVMPTSTTDGCAGTVKPCPGAPIVNVALVDAVTMQDLATVWTSPPLGNYSYGSFTQYSPPVEVHVHGLNISNANPVLIQLRVTNNKRNLQIQLAPKTGLNMNISWTNQAYATNKSSCDSDCVQATLTTNKCGVSQPLIQPLSILGASTKVGSDKTLGLTAPRPAFLWTDGFQTAFTDEHGESNALAASGIGAGFGSTVTIPPSETETVIRLFVGVIGTNGQLTATLNGTKRVAPYNTTFTASPRAVKFGAIALQVPAGTVPRLARVEWFQTGPGVRGAVLLGAIAVDYQSNATALAATAQTSPVRKCVASSQRSGHAGTVMLQAAALT